MYVCSLARAGAVLAVGDAARPTARAVRPTGPTTGPTAGLTIVPPPGRKMSDCLEAATRLSLYAIQQCTAVNSRGGVPLSL